MTRKSMVEKDHPQLSVRKQCGLLAVNRNRLAPKPAKKTGEDGRLMRLIDEIHLNEPTYGARRMCLILKRDHGLCPGRKRIRRLMRLMGLEAICPRPRTSLPGPGHERHPYLLKDLEVVRPNQVWCADITYIPMAVGFCYLMAVMDWHSRAVLGWAVSPTMDAQFCLKAWELAVEKAGCVPEIMNTDQGSQFTSNEWTGAMKGRGVRISMDGKGRWVDNVFVERLWWSVKYEDIYLKAYETPRDVEQGLTEWFERYTTYRPHSKLDGRTPWEAHTEEAA